MKPAQDSKRRAQARTTQYMSHGFRSAGSVDLRALYEAKTGNRNVGTEDKSLANVSNIVTFVREDAQTRRK